MSNVTEAIDAARRAWATTDPDQLQQLHDAARAAPAARSLTEVLSADELALIVEPKRATATRGTINPQLDIAAVADECEAAGASAISVVTEPHLSGGSIDDLRAARVASSLPILARDFVSSVAHVHALRAAGADALLIPAHMWVEEDRAADAADAYADEPVGTGFGAIVRAAHALGMEVVLSVQTDEELAFCVDCDVDAINIDNRDQRGDVDVERTFELLAEVPVGWPVISESIAAADQVAKLHRAGVDALLLDEGHIDTGLTSALAVYADLTLDS